MRKIIVIIIFIVIGFWSLYVVSPYIYLTRSLSFDNCSVSYRYYLLGRVKLYEGHYITNEDEIFYANRKLALCLLDEYIKTNSNNIKVKLLELNKTYSSNRNIIEIDSIVKYRFKLFDPIIYID